MPLDPYFTAAVKGPQRRPRMKIRAFFKLKDRVPVVCVELNRRFPSTTAAATAMGFNKNAVSQALRTGGTSGGYHWKRA